MKTILLPLRVLGLMVLAAVMCIGVSSCNSDDDGPVVYNVQEFATFVGNMGDRSEFSVQRTGNGPVYTLYGKGKVSEQAIKAGSRVLIAYQLTAANDGATTPDATVSLPTGGEIDLISVYGVLTLTPKPVDIEADSVKNWNLNQVYLEQISRTGAFINLIARVECNSNELLKTFDLYVDSKTLDTKEPQLYIRYNRPQTMSSTVFVPMSLNVNTYWNNPNYEGVTLNIANSKDPSRQRFQFLKKNEGFTD